MVGNRAARLAGEGRENNFNAAEIAELQGLAAGHEAEFIAVAGELDAFIRRDRLSDPKPMTGARTLPRKSGRAIDAVPDKT
jgi:hypothetical protein